MGKRKTLLAELREEIARKPAMNRTYLRELARLELANQILQARQRAKMSQAELATRVGTKQPAIARMEQAAYPGYNVGTLAKIAAATAHQLEVRLVPRKIRVAAKKK